MEYLIGAIAGIVLTISIILLFKKIIVSAIEKTFGDISTKALSTNSDEFLKLAKESLSKQTELGEKELEGKKKLIDQTLENIKTEIGKVDKTISELEKDREKKLGEVSTQIQTAAKSTLELQKTTEDLKNALKSTQERGKWGERIAEDILKVIGFIENVNYLKDKSLETNQNRPDYTLLLPRGLKLNMDVKFPYDNYLKYFEAQSESEKENFKKDFFKDVKRRIKEVTNKNYINPEENTLDYVLVFIPIEHIYSFIHEHDSSILDEALKNKVVLCSPYSFYAILSVIRQALDSFNLEQTTSEILPLMGAFKKQYEEFVKSFDKVGTSLENTLKEFNALRTTRQNQLEKPLRRIDDLRQQKQITFNNSSVEEVEEVV